MDMARRWTVGVWRQANPPPGQAEGPGEAETSVKAIPPSPCRLEKPRCYYRGCPYRKPTLVGGGKYREVIERTFVKELCNLAP